MIYIKNVALFKLKIEHKCHWSNLTRLRRKMESGIFSFPCGANLCEADLREANLCGADLCGADLCEAKLQMIEGKEVTIEDYMSVLGLGSVNRATFFFKTNIGVVVQCGCFYGTQKSFEGAIKKTHGDNQYAKEYLAILEVVKIRFNRED